MSDNISNDFFSSSDSVRSAHSLNHAQKVTFSEPLLLQNGSELPNVTIVYETYGTLNENKDNAILICHALSGDSHVASHDEDDDPGWWEILVGPDKMIDTNKYFVICPNVLGGCRGTTGPDSINPMTGQRYGMDFPSITIADIVEVQYLLIRHLGIERLLAVIGGSLGGLMVLDWTTRFPDRVSNAVAIAVAPRLTSQSLAFDIVARNAIQSDPHFYGGQYYDKGTGPSTGLAIARMLGHITYLSRESMTRKFDATRNVGRQLDTSFETKFSVGSYLAHQGNKFVERFDANSYLTLSMVIDTFDLGETQEERIQLLRKSMCRWLIISFSSDWLFPPFQAQEIVRTLIAVDKRVSYCNIESDCGHDAFLLENNLPLYGGLIQAFLKNGYEEHVARAQFEPMGGLSGNQRAPAHLHGTKHRIDYDGIIDLIPPQAKILDLGCGKGDLLYQLKQRGHSHLVGMEIEEQLILKCVHRGLDVLHSDINKGLKDFADKQFDFVILSKTLQTVRNVELILEEMLRVGTRVIVSFPNLGYYRFRAELNESGRAPRIDPRPGRLWYNTNDVRFLTLTDFEQFCHEKGYRIHRQIAFDTELDAVVESNPNLNADVAIVVLSRE